MQVLPQVLQDGLRRLRVTYFVDGAAVKKRIGSGILFSLGCKSGKGGRLPPGSTPLIR